MQQQDKKQIYIGPTIQHIQNSQFLIKNNNNILLLNKRQLHLLNTQSQSITTSKIDTQRVSSCTYHQQLNIYLIKTQHDIYIINQIGESLGKINLQNQIALMESRFIFILNIQDGPQQDPHQRIDKLIYITDQNLHISDIKVQFQRAILKRKVINHFKFQLSNKNKQKSTHIDPTIIFDAPQWIEKCKIFKQLGYFVCYNKNQIMVFKIPKFRQQTLVPYLTYYKKSSKNQQNMITDVAISFRQKQIIFSHQSGVIKIYRFNQSKKYLQQLKGHQKQCQSLFISDKNNKDLLYSCGLDNTVRIWNLYQFQQIYALRIDLICDSIILLSDQMAFIKSASFRRTSLCKINAYKMQPMMGQNKNAKVTSIKADSQWAIVLYSNNYAQMFLISQDVDQNHKKLAMDPMEQINGKKLKNYIEKIQFPLKYGNVVSAKKLRKNQYAIILQKGFSMITLDKDEIVSQNFELKKLVYNQQISHMHEIKDSQEQQVQMDQFYNVHQVKQSDRTKNMASSIQNNNETSNNVQKKGTNQNSQNNRLTQLIHQKLLGTYLFSIIEDWKGIPTAITVTYVTFIVGKKVPMWDVDQKKKIVNLNSQDGDLEEKQRKRKKSLIPNQQQKKENNLVHVVIGTQKGAIFIVDVQNRSQFQSRITMHSGSIRFIQQFFPKGYSTSNSVEMFFLSYDHTKQICLWSISENLPPTAYCRVSNHLNMTHLSLHKSFILLGQKQGKVSVLQIVHDLQKYQQSNQQFLSPSFKKKSSRNSSRGSSHGKRSANLIFKQTKNDGLYGHMKKVTTGDHIYYKHKNLFITGSEDCSIKLWLGLQKILLFQLKIFDTIEHIRFIKNGLDFMMSHHDQISVIKGKNVQQIMKIEHDLDKKYSNLPHVGQQTIQIKSFFSKQGELFYSSIMKKTNNFRLKNKKSTYAQLIGQIDLKNNNQNYENNQYQNGGYSPSNYSGFSSSNFGKIHPIIQQKSKQFQEQVNFLTKLNDKQEEEDKNNVHKKDQIIYLSPQKTKQKDLSSLIYSTNDINQQKLKIYSKSQQKLKSRSKDKQKRSFHIVNTSFTKQQNQSYFLLPKIMVKNKQSRSQMNKIRNSPYTSFKANQFLSELKSKKQKAYSYFARYQK